MKFENRTTLASITHAMNQADRLLNPDSIMCRELITKNDWRYGAPKSGALVVMTLVRNDPWEVPIFTFRPKEPTRSLGYHDINGIHFNIETIEQMTTEEMVGFILHEWSHRKGFDHLSPFWTSNFKTKEKCLYSVPYYLSENVSRWL